MKQKILFFILLLFAVAAQAQFVAVEWSRAQSDSLLPVCSQVLPLPADYEGYEYSAAVEYPEYTPMSAEEVARYRLRAGEVSSVPVVETYVSIAAKEPQLNILFLPVVCTDGKFKRIESYKLSVKREPRAERAPASLPRTSAPARYAENSLLAQGRWVKISVTERGMHQITSAELAKMGFKEIDKVRLYGYGGTILPETNIHTLPDDLCEVPLWREGGRLLFYATGTVSWNYKSGKYEHAQNYYSQQGYYFITESDEPLPAFPAIPSADSYAATLTTYPDYLLYENDEISLCSFGRVMLDGYNFAKGRSRSYSFDLTGFAGSTLSADVSFGTSAEATSSVAVEINGKKLGNIGLPQLSSADLGKISVGKFNATPAANTTVKLTHSVSVDGQSGYLDYIRLNFNRDLAFRTPQMNFRGNGTAGNAKFVIAQAPASLCVLNVSSSADIYAVEGTHADGKFSFAAPASSGDEYVAFDTKASFPSVKIVGAVSNQNLHAMGQTDMVIIVPSSGKLLSAAERLAEAHRHYDAMTVAVVTAEQVYNEFSSGTPDATAYRRFVKMLYDRAADAAAAPKYLLLFGDGCVDNRMLGYPSRTPDDYLLCYESENSVSAVYSYVLEDYFGFLDDSEGGYHKRDKIDVGVGRLPVKTASEAEAVVDKLISYMRNDEAGAWQNVVALLGDDGDKDIPNQHMKDAEAVAAVMKENYPGYIVDRIYWDNFEPVANSTGNSYPQVTSTIYDRLNEGALVVNYSGHGSATTMSHEMAWLVADMQALSSPRLPFWVTASCDIGPFDLGDNSLAESALLNPVGGAVGLLTTTRTVLQVYNSIINRAFMQQLLTPSRDGRKLAVGDALRIAKNNVINASSDLSENKLQFVLLGDPALRLKLPEYNIVVESFNGVPAKQQADVPAGGTLTVQGYVSAPDGSVAADFTGLLSATLFDSEEEVITKDNLGLGTFSYTAHEKKLFAGSDSVKNGKFSITMPVPMDISYSGEAGLLNFFSVDNAKARSAQGTFDNFLIAGTAPSDANDGKGPEIKVYLNTPSFTDGDEVNATPCLFAEFYDENGINTIGTGIGHDIKLEIDNDINHTYNLNDAYKPVVGDYKRGTVVCPLKELPAGEHKLILRAWDIFNNSTVVELSFVVVPHLAPQLANLTLAPNPARGGVTSYFELLHDLPQSTLDITVEVLDFQGRVLWRNSEKTVCDGGVYTLAWNVTSQGGSPLPTGVYLYRAYMSSGESKAATKTGKFMVINNK